MPLLKKDKEGNFLNTAVKVGTGIALGAALGPVIGKVAGGLAGKAMSRAGGLLGKVGSKAAGAMEGTGAVKGAKMTAEMAKRRAAQLWGKVPSGPNVPYRAGGPGTAPIGISLKQRVGQIPREAAYMARRGMGGVGRGMSGAMAPIGRAINRIPPRAAYGAYGGYLAYPGEPEQPQDQMYYREPVTRYRYRPRG